MLKVVPGFLLFVMVLLSVGCENLSTKQPPIDYTNPRLVLGGQAPYGRVELLIASDGSIEGRVPYGQVKLRRDGSRIFGKSPFGNVDLTYNSGRLSGQVPYGKVELNISESALTGKIPYGRVALLLNQKNLKGRLPYGSTDLYLGNRYGSLINPDVILAIAALISDKT